jgi:hypothetical protein
MSTSPRRLLTDTLVQWGEPTAPPLLVRHGSIVDIPLGSALETAYGGSSNLSAVIPLAQRGHPDALDKSWLAN